MSTNGCCEDEIKGAYLGDGTTSTIFTERQYAILFQPKFKEDGTLNTLDLTQANMEAYLKGKIQTTTAADERIYPTGKLDFIEIPERTAFGSYQKTDQSTVIVDSVGGIQKINIGWDKDRATFERLRQLKNMECSQWQVYFLDVEVMLALFKESKTATIGRGFDVNMQSFERMFKMAQGTEASRVMASFELEREASFDHAYGLAECDTNMTLSDFDPLHPANMVFVSETSLTEIIVKLEHASGKARNNKFFTGAAAATYSIKPKGAAAIAATAVENVNETYTLTLASAMPATTNYKASVSGVANWGFSGFSGTSGT